MSRVNRLVVVALAVAALSLIVPSLASAHERRQIGDGRYQLVVGFSTEPAYSGFLNGLDLRVSDLSQATPAADGTSTGAPVEGLESTLQAEIIYGDQKMALTIEPRFRAPGEYDAWVVPMAAGDYSFHIFGTTGDLQVDETFTSGPETFGAVNDQVTIQFPQQTSSTGGPVFGTVVDDGGFNTTAAGGALAGVAIGAAGLYLIQRRRGRALAPHLAAVRAGSGD